MPMSVEFRGIIVNSLKFDSKPNVFTKVTLISDEGIFFKFINVKLTE